MAKQINTLITPYQRTSLAQVNDTLKQQVQLLTEALDRVLVGQAEPEDLAYAQYASVRARRHMMDLFDSQNAGGVA